MSLAAFLLALLVPPADSGGPLREPVQPAGEAPAEAVPDQPPVETPGWPYLLLQGFVQPPANQVRIEQRVTIRVAPRSMVQPNLLAALPNREIGPRFVERKMGKCLAVGRIGGVQTNGTSRLILYMRDQRIISAELERACRARDFYSGFYLAQSNDGMLCVDRDTLLSRSGANCKLTRIRQLVEDD